MQLRSNLFAAALVAAGLIASSASAASVHYVLDLSTDNAFTLTAAVSDGDNGGLSTYGIPLTGTVLTLDHRTPNAISGANFQPAGFNNLRSPDNSTSLSASQPLGGPNTIYGFGQEVSSYALKGIPTIGHPDPTSDIAWLDPMVIAIGTYERLSGTLGFDTASADLLAGVFGQSGVDVRIAADVTTQVIPFPTGGDQFEVNDSTIGPRQAGALVVGGPLPTNDSDDPDSLTWLLESLTGPGGAISLVGAGAPTVSTTTGLFSWQSLASNPLGAYSALIRGTNANAPIGTDTGTLSFNLVPEPASITLLGLAMVGAIGFIRRR